jgi:hypothetical protein
MSIKAEPSFSPKDELFNRTSVTGFQERELKSRIQWRIECLHRHLSADFNEATTILQPPPLDRTLMDDGVGRFIRGVPAEYIAQYGCNKTRLTQSLEFMRESTKRFSTENPIRALLLNFPEQTMELVHRCAKDKNYHVRRLAPQGIRPLLR